MFKGYALIIGPADTPYAYGNYLFEFTFGDKTCDFLLFFLWSLICFVGPQAKTNKVKNRIIFFIFHSIDLCNLHKNNLYNSPLGIHYIYKHTNFPYCFLLNILKKAFILKWTKQLTDYKTPEKYKPNKIAIVIDIIDQKSFSEKEMSSLHIPHLFIGFLNFIRI